MLANVWGESHNSLTDHVSLLINFNQSLLELTSILTFSFSALLAKCYSCLTPSPALDRWPLMERHGLAVWSLFSLSLLQCLPCVLNLVHTWHSLLIVETDVSLTYLYPSSSHYTYILYDLMKFETAIKCFENFIHYQYIHLQDRVT